MKIQKYSFGNITVGGTDFKSDIILMPDRNIKKWWRQTSHLVELDDIIDLLTANPKLLIIGTGYYGLMKIDKKVTEYCNAISIQLISCKTRKAIEKYNSSTSDFPIAALHLTC
jgi:hypothetical protein